MGSTRRRPLFALTLQRPWSYAVTHLGKALENRDWAPPPHVVGHHIAIHAGAAWDDKAPGWIRSHLHLEVPTDDQLPKKLIVAVVRVVGFVEREEDVPGAQRPWIKKRVPERRPWAGWLLDDLVVLPEPVPVDGQQKLWIVTDPELSRVRAGWLAARRGAA